MLGYNFSKKEEEVTNGDTNGQNSHRQNQKSFLRAKKAKFFGTRGTDTDKINTESIFTSTQVKNNSQLKDTCMGEINRCQNRIASSNIKYKLKNSFKYEKNRILEK